MTKSSPYIGARRDIAVFITSKILAELEQGVLPWRKPWNSARTGLALPRRATGEAYRGVNVLILWSAALERGYASPYWLTFNQAVKLGAHVRKGERGELVVYHGQGVRKRIDEHGADAKDAFHFLKCYVVFTANHDLPARFHAAIADRVVMPIAAHEAWFSGLEIKRIPTHDIACYSASKDAVALPAIAAFDTPEHYGATLNHESVHATMAAHRVGRDMDKRFKVHALAGEELVAEIGASLLGAHLKLPPHHIHDHAAYIGHWMKLLADDKRAFFTAAAHAQRAVDWLLAKSPVTSNNTETLSVEA